MSTETNNGGPAFPHEYKYGDGTAQRADGMSLRDYFAAKAMHGVLSNSWIVESFGFDHERNSKEAYAIADAMLKARQS